MPAIAVSDTPDDYRGEEDHRTLTRAEEIRADSSRMKGVRKHHTKQTRMLSRMSRSMRSTHAAR